MSKQGTIQKRSNEPMYKTDKKKRIKEGKSDNFCYCKGLRAKTTTESPESESNSTSVC